MAKMTADQKRQMKRLVREAKAQTKRQIKAIKVNLRRNLRAIKKGTGQIVLGPMSGGGYKRPSQVVLQPKRQKVLRPKKRFAKRVPVRY